MVGISFQVLRPIENFLNVPYKLSNLFINLHRLQINDADGAVQAAGSHNYDENINRSIIQFAIKIH